MKYIEKKTHRNEAVGMFATKNLKPDEALAILNCRRLPACLSSELTAVLLGFKEPHIAILIRAKLLKPLDDPSPNAQKYFAAVDITAVAAEPAWLSKARRAVKKHAQEKNQKMKKERRL